jgi:hypothetical protein
METKSGNIEPLKKQNPTSQSENGVLTQLMETSIGLSVGYYSVNITLK